MAETVRLNKYNRSSSDFVTPGMQLHYVAQVKPDETAAIVVHKDWQEERISWSELDKLSSRIAWMLMDKGVGQNSTVLVSYPNTIEHIAANFAIWKTGACYMPISWRTPPEELLELQKLLCPSAALTDIDVTETMFKCGMSELAEACAGYPDEMPPDVISNHNKRFRRLHRQAQADTPEHPLRSLRPLAFKLVRSERHEDGPDAAPLRPALPRRSAHRGHERYIRRRHLSSVVM